LIEGVELGEHLDGTSGAESKCAFVRASLDADHRPITVPSREERIAGQA